MASTEELEEVLLSASTGGLSSKRGSSHYWNAVLNLSKVILGAGIMTVPKAISILGVLPGIVVLAAVATMTWFTVDSICATSLRRGFESYATLVCNTCGAWAKHVLNVCIVTGCLGVEVTYYIIISDILRGLLSSLPSGWSSSPVFSQPAVMAVITIGVALPLSLQRNIGHLKVFNAIGLLALSTFVASLIILAAVALINGQAQTLPLWPTSSTLLWMQSGVSSDHAQLLESGDRTRSYTLTLVASLAGLPMSVAKAANISLLSVLPVLIGSSACHQSLHPLLHVLRPRTVAGMRSVATSTLGGIAILYVILAVSSLLVFGEDVDEDILVNMSPSGMEPFVGTVLAYIMSLTVRIGYLLSLLASVPLIMFPLRNSTVDMIAEFRPDFSNALERHFVTLTTVIILLVYLLNLAIGSVWLAVSLVSSTSVMVVCFIFPGLIMWNEVKPSSSTFWARKIFSGFVVVMGCILFVNGVKVSLWSEGL